MESIVSNADNLLPNESENINLNEATPAVTPIQESDLPNDPSCISSEAVECDNAISSTTPDKFVIEQLDPNPSNLLNFEGSGLNVETDADFFAAELSISDVRTEKITENVEDIVQDLENLLGESNDSYRFSREPFDNPKVSETYDEVNSSNVEDLVQQTDLYQVEATNVESIDLDSSTLKCNILPEDSVITSDNIINAELNASLPLEIPGTTTDSSDKVDNVIVELKDIKANEPAEIFDLVESTEKADTIINVNDEFKNITQESVPAEIAKVAEFCANSDNGVISSYTNEVTEETGAACSNVAEINDEGNESCISERQVLETRAEVIYNPINKEQESKTEITEENVGVDVILQDNEKINTNLEEELQIPIDIDKNLMICEQQQENVAELLQELVEDAAIVNADSMCEENFKSTEALLEATSTDIVLENACEIKQHINKEEVAIVDVPEPEQADVQQVVQKQETSVEDILPEVKHQDQEPDLNQQEDLGEALFPEVQDQEQVNQEEATFAEAEPCIDQQQIVISETEEHKNSEPIVLPVESSEADVTSADTNINDNDSSVNTVPENSITDENVTEQCHSLSEAQPNRNTDLEQPLTVEVEDLDINEQQLAEVPAREEIEDKYEVSSNKLEEVNVIKTAGEDTIPTDKKSPISETVEENQSSRAPLKMTIAKQSENVHSILKIYDPNEVSSSQEQQIPKLIIKTTPSTTNNDEDEAPRASEEHIIPKITIKPILTPPLESQHSPKLTIKPIKPPVSNEDQGSPRATIKSCASSTGSPRITIKPVIKPEALSPLKLTLRPFPKIEDVPSSPKLNIKPIVKPQEDIAVESHHSPKITIKPIIKPPEESQSYTEERHSPRITIKPIVKPPEELLKSENENVHSPRITIKPIIKPQEDSEQNDDVPPVQHPFKLNIKPVVRPAESSLSSKITIKPVQKPPEVENETIELIDFEEQIKQERIVLKIAKNTKKEKVENEKVKKIKVKLSKEGGTAHIVSAASRKRPASEESEQESKHFKAESTSDLTISLVPSTTAIASTPDITITPVDSISMLKTEESSTKRTKQEDNVASDAYPPANIENLSSASTANMEELPDPLADIPVFEITLQTAAAMSNAPTKSVAASTAANVAGAPPAPRKRGRPRKVPLEVREEFKDPKEEEVPPPVVEESTRPKRSCRGASVRATLGIKPRKPRASNRGRGGKRTVSTRATPGRKSKESKLAGKTKQPKESMVKEPEFKDFEAKDVEFKQVPLPTESTNREVVIYEEETRMSAENSSRAQTPAKQVLTSSTEVIEESQSSVQSNTTTESGEKIQKARKGPRLEVHQEPEGEVISADKLAEYSWGGGGPYMLQEQVAQFLGIKSFKRKYPGIQRRPVDMQERDFIRESCLASEAMCDMGLTAVKSEDILDIMYTDFQHKYEEYCKHQRDRQAKDVSNKQKALSLAASQEKTKLDIVEQAVQSAFQWNASFNKARREQRRACMDLQTFTVHFPKGRMKQVNKPPMGHYPLALVPGQFTDYYKKYNPYELSNLPINSIGCKNITLHHDTEESQSDASGSDSDSSSSDSDSSCSSSGAEDCKMCRPTALSNKKMLVH